MKAAEKDSPRILAKCVMDPKSVDAEKYCKDWASSPMSVDKSESASQARRGEPTCVGPRTWTRSCGCISNSGRNWM